MACGWHSKRGTPRDKLNHEPGCPLPGADREHAALVARIKALEDTGKALLKAQSIVDTMWLGTEQEIAARLRRDASSAKVAFHHVLEAKSV